MLPTLQQAIAAIKAGDKKTGRAYLAEILQADPENETAWLWMAGVVESDERRRQCLERVLEVNPDNQAAKRGLASLPPRPDAAPKLPVSFSSEARGPLMSRLAARQQEEIDQLPEVDLTPVEASSQRAVSAPTPEPSGSIHTEPPQATPTEPARVPPVPAAREPFFEESPPVSEEEPVESEPYEAPAPPSEQSPSYWQTDQGKLVLVGSVASLLILCVVCVAGVVVFQPFIARIPPTVAAVVGTSTPTSTFTPTPVPPTDTPTSVPTPTVSPTLTASATSTQVVANTPTLTLTPTRTPTPERDLQTATVVGVVSGDTIDVMLEGVNYRLKYIMTEAPVVNAPDQAPEPFGLEAMELNRHLVEGQQVQLEKDQQETDESGQLLRYVYVNDQMVNEALIRQGLARAVLVPPNTKYGARLQQSEQAAREAGLGIWSVEPSE